jgi:SAM-dependent methyltransferase
MVATNGRRDWQDLAAEDPLWAVLSAPEKRHGGWQEEEFLETGERDVARLMGMVDSLGRPTDRGRALDFGCGPGRLTRALSSHFREVVGVDISEHMVVRARELNADRPACSFEVMSGDDLGRLPAASFDLVYTTLVLQHMQSREEILVAIEGLLERVRIGGLLVFQVPVHIPLMRRLRLRHHAYRGLRAMGVSPSRLLNSGALNPMRMTSVPRADLDALLARRGASVGHVGETVLADGTQSATLFVTRA